MRIAYCSDLHLERGPVNFELPEAQVLILAGDICVQDDLRDSFIGSKFPDSSREFFLNVSAKYEHVLYIPGNHEHWSGDLAKTTSGFNTWAREQGIKNVVCSTRTEVLFPETRFILATLWTDMNRGSPLTMNRARGLMNDYSQIKYDTCDLRPEDIFEINVADRKFIRENLDHPRIIVITHHAPSVLGHDREQSNYTHFYHNTGLEEMIMDNPQITHWIHGHTHDAMDHVIGKTRILCNPRGYVGLERIAEQFQIRVFDI